jgi:methyl-accepting chemotaxis protein
MGLVALGIGLLGLSGMRLMEQGLQRVYQDSVVPLRELKDVSDGFNVGGVATAQRVRDRSITWEQGHEALRVSRATLDQSWKHFREHKFAGEEQAKVEGLEPQLDKANQALTQLEKILDRKDAQELELFVSLDLFPAVQPATATLDQLIHLQLEDARHADEEAAAAYQRARGIGVTAVVLGLLLGFGLAWASIRRLLQQLGGEPASIAETARRIAEGDLTAALRGRGQPTGVQAAFLVMQDRLSSALSAAARGADLVAAVAAQISASARAVSDGASTQAAAVQETSASLEQMNATINQNALSGRECERLALHGQERAATSAESVKSAIQAMKAIAGRISVIDEIAHRTNLLSLNAQIEAARAGNVGRGFAVVATEVRRLAERSQLAANEVRQLASDGQTKSDTSGEQLEDLLVSIRKTTGLVQDVAAASSEQASGVGQINRAISQVDTAAQRSAAAAEELAAAATQLAGHAEGLQQQMKFFRVQAA